MGKLTKRTRGTNINHPNMRGASFEHQESFDDNFLPEAAELAHLKELDPNVIDWIKARVEQEQNERISLNKQKMDLVTKTTNKAQNTDILSILCALTVVLAGMGFSAYMIANGMKIEGTIFAGGTLVIATQSFLNFRKVSDSKPSNKMPQNQ